MKGALHTTCAHRCYDRLTGAAHKHGMQLKRVVAGDGAFMLRRRHGLLRAKPVRCLCYRHACPLPNLECCEPYPCHAVRVRHAEQLCCASVARAPCGSLFVAPGMPYSVQLAYAVLAHLLGSGVSHQLQAALQVDMACWIWCKHLCLHEDQGSCGQAQHAQHAVASKHSMSQPARTAWHVMRAAQAHVHSQPWGLAAVRQPCTWGRRGCMHMAVCTLQGASYMWVM